jgi:hypothetical protein
MNRELEDRFWSKVQRGEGCWLWTASVGTDGYGHFGVYRPEDRSFLGLQGTNARAHRVAWVLAGNQLPHGGTVLCHSCDTPLCVRPDHLSIGTVSMNARDAYSRGLAPQKLSADDVAKMRRLYANGEKGTEIARRFGVSNATAYNTVTGHRHADDSGPIVRHERRVGSVDRCPIGHPYDEANTRRNPRGIQRCRACDRERARARRAAVASEVRQ